jgi:hypothetical protein
VLWNPIYTTFWMRNSDVTVRMLAAKGQQGNSEKYDCPMAV